MKRTLPVLALFFVSFVADGAKDLIGVAGPLEYNATSFELVKSEHPSTNYYAQYYVPKGEKLDSFQQLLTVFVYDSAYSPEAAADDQIRQLVTRKATDPMCNYQKTVQKQKGEFMVDFISSDTKGEALLAMRFTIYRYKKITLGKKRTGLVVYGYSSQRYLDSITPYLKGLREERVERLNELGNTTIPEIKIAGK